MRGKYTDFFPVCCDLGFLSHSVIVFRCLLQHVWGQDQQTCLVPRDLRSLEIQKRLGSYPRKLFNLYRLRCFPLTAFFKTFSYVVLTRR